MSADDIIKICKKHGGLTVENTYLINSKSGNTARACSICRKGYKKDWQKRNPEKYKKWGSERKYSALKELENGNVKKNCKKHGDIPLDRIRIDTRGTLICKICDNENKKNSVNKNKIEYIKKCREWRKRNPEKLKQYALNYKPKRKPTDKAIYKNKKNNPLLNKKMLEQQRKSAQKARDSLSDAYVRSQIRVYQRGGKNNQTRFYMKGIQIPQEIIELRKIQIKLNRELRKQRKVRHGD